MNKIAFIYPGQGSQKCGMGKDFYNNSKFSKDVYNSCSDIVDFDIKKMCFEENEDINKTEYTQPCMVTTSLAMTKEIENRGFIPDFTAGLSLGEYCAISVSGGLKFTDAVKITRTRGILMQQAVPFGVGAMAAIIGLKTNIVEECIEKYNNVSIANYNCPGQIVITGKADEVNKACECLKAVGAKRTVLLNVSGPFHSKMLSAAGWKLEDSLNTIKLNDIKIPYVTNVTANIITDKSIVKELLVKQISSSVKWEQTINVLIKQGVNTFVEIGPGKTLSSFIRKINKNVQTINIEKWMDLEKLEVLKNVR